MPPESPRAWSPASLRHAAHQLAGLVVADGQVGHPESTPPGLLLRRRHALERQRELTHVGIAQRVMVNRHRRAPSRTMASSSGAPAVRG